ncbi:MAG: amidohydrolase [Gemmatimonadota bacterium]
MSPRTTHPLLSLTAAALTLVVAACAEPAEPADLVLRGGTVVTADEGVPEGEAVAIRGGRIQAVGTDKEIRAFIGRETEVVELEGRTAIPGFIEGHGHYTGVGRAAMQLDLMDVANWDEVVAMVQAAVAQAQPGELIAGRGWHQEKWDRRPEPNVDGLPHHDGLSAVSPDNPVILTHASGHATFANAKAMELAGITRATRDPEGGEIVRDAQGNPIGAFRETASGLLGPARRNAPPVDPRRVILMAQEEAFSKGITSFQDAGSGFETVDLLKEMVDDGSLKIRMWVMLRVPNAELAEKMDAYRMIGYGDRLTVRAIKKSIDGALGSHGAWLLEPYDDLPSSTGLNTTPVEDVAETARLAAEHGYQLCVHAIGDRANREVLDVYAETFLAHPAMTDHRWRIEHAQHLHPADIQRFGQLGVIASMQGIHATSDGPWVEPKLGARRAEEGAYVWQKLMQSGALVTNGTDAPVEDVDPLASYYATVSRMMSTGERFYPGQRMSRMEALKSYTINNAYAAFEEDVKGTLTPGKLADVTVLSKNILAVPEEEIPGTTVEMTIVGGEVVYRAGSGG